jgi:acetolactate synthase small subunit
MTFTVDGGHDIEQVPSSSQGDRSRKDQDVTDEETVARELALIKIATTKETRGASSDRERLPREIVDVAATRSWSSYRHRDKVDAIIGC